MSVVAVVAAMLADVDVKAPGFSSVDGVELCVGNPILLASQRWAPEGGVWQWVGADAPLERPPAPHPYASGWALDLTTMIWVAGGETLGRTMWCVTASDDASAITWAIIVDETPHALVLGGLPLPGEPTFPSLGSSPALATPYPFAYEARVPAFEGPVLWGGDNRALTGGVYVVDRDAWTRPNAGPYAGPVDGVELSSGDLVWLVEQAEPAMEGLWVVTELGSKGP